jgi:antitoxin Phd
MTSQYNDHIMAHWQVQDAKARFSELLDAAVKNGPQVVTRRGIETAVLVPMEEWRRLQKSGRPSLKQLLLSPTPRFPELVHARRRFRRRPPVDWK